MAIRMCRKRGAFRPTRSAPGVPGYLCRLVFDNVYTVVRANTPSSVKEMSAAQYALLAIR
jgi:hypothetical protein